MKPNIELSGHDTEWLRALAKDRGVSADALAKTLLVQALNTVGADELSTVACPNSSNSAVPQALLIDPKDPRILDTFANESVIQFDNTEVSLLFAHISQAGGYVKPSVRVTMPHWSFITNMGLWASRWRCLHRAYKSRAPFLFGGDVEEVKAALDEMNKTPVLLPPGIDPPHSKP